MDESLSNLSRSTKRFYRKFNSFPAHKKLLAVFLLVLVLPLSVYLVKSFTLYLSQAATAQVSFSPSTVSMPPNTSPGVVVNSGSTQIAFARVDITFDVTKVNLSSEINITGPLKAVIGKSTMATANSTGRIAVVVALCNGIDIPCSPSPVAPSGTFELFKLPLTSITSQTTATTIAYDVSTMQLVDTAQANVALTAVNGTVNLNPVSATSTNTPTLTSAVTSTSTPTQPPTGSGGLTGSYYNGLNFNTFVFSRVDPTINYDWQLGAPDSRITADIFSARWTGFVTPRFSDTYTFYGSSDDGIRVTVNNQLIIDSWLDQPAAEHPGTIALTAGVKYPITVEYYENTGLASAKLLWSSANQVKEVVPSSQLSIASTGGGTATATPTRSVTLAPSPTVSSGAAATTLSLTASASSVNLNQNLPVNVQINTGTNSVIGVDLDVTFNPANLNLQDITAGSFLSNADVTNKVIDNTNGRAKLTLAVSPGSPARQGSGTLATLTFKAVGVGTTRVDFGSNNLVAATGTNGVNALKSVTGLGLTVTNAFILGDINKDGCVDIVDYVILFANFGKLTTDTGADARADINNDGRINILDYTYLFENFGKCIATQ